LTDKHSNFLPRDVNRFYITKGSMLVGSIKKWK